ncbi:MAG: RagB/SusD family nutrient uptake outer membrane protein, partial [Bacteroidota bacterium]
PPQTSRADIFDFIEADLLDIQEELLPPGEAPLGRADRAAAWMLLAKLYLNSTVYTGVDRSSDCIEMCNRIISSGAYNLAPNYENNFETDNNLFGEIIFPIIHEGILTESFGGVSTFVGHASQGGPDDASGALGIAGGWSGIRPLENLFDVFPTNFSVDARARFDTTRLVDDMPVGRNVRAEVLSGGDFGVNGYILTKISNLSSLDVPGSDGEFLDTDFPMFRLADVYLMLAESVLRGGSGATQSEALELVNDLRERAYGDDTGNITEAELTLDFILDERARELHWEMHRRQDLIRFDNFTTSGIWQFKGGDLDGQTTEAFRNLYPIPSTQISAYGGALTQNPGYN